MSVLGEGEFHMLTLLAYGFSTEKHRHCSAYRFERKRFESRARHRRGMVAKFIEEAVAIYLQRSGTARKRIRYFRTFVGRTQHRRGCETFDLEFGLVPAACERKKFVSRAPPRRG